MKINQRATARFLVGTAILGAVIFTIYSANQNYQKHRGENLDSLLQEMIPIKREPSDRDDWQMSF